MAGVVFDSVGKTYPNGTRAVSSLDLEVADGEFMVFVGPSGCGKTTALRMVAGLEVVSEGELRIGDRTVNRIEPRKRDVAMVFQNYALYPHMTVRDNISFPLRARGVDRRQIRARVERIADLVGLQELLERRPRTLSGGQRQRVAMARAIVREPEVFLMDEPLSNLDAKLRAQMRAEISTLQRELGVTTIYVTHDQVEAMTMGSRIAVMRKGVLQQVGTPQELYDRPANLFVATFIGSPSMNLFEAEFHAAPDGPRCSVGTQSVALPSDTVELLSRRGIGGGRRIVLGIRPENVRPGLTTSGTSALHGVVTLVEALGSEQLIHASVDAKPVITDEILEIAQDIDAATLSMLEQDARGHHVPVVARVGREAPPRIGETVDLVLETRFLHLFEPESGRRIV